jgi:hypothetical protein
MMEKASKFISLSGISGILAGCIALLGAGAAWWYLYLFLPEADKSLIFDSMPVSSERIVLLFSLAVFTFAGSFFAAAFFTTRNSKKKKLPVWDFHTKRLFFNLMLPIVTGAVFIIALTYYHFYILILPASLIFYGLSLINASHFTYSDIKYLGFLEILVGITGLVWVEITLLLWAIGFGILHIIYGIRMYFKYER